MPSLLIVDDEAAFRHAFQHAFRDEGITLSPCLATSLRLKAIDAHVPVILIT